MMSAFRSAAIFLLTTSVVAAVEPAQKTAPPLNVAPKFADVVLGDHSELRGQVVNREGIGKPRAAVLVADRRGAELARTTTDARGEFQLSLSGPGLVLLSSGDTTAPLRIWSNSTAPPHAARAYLLVDAPTVVRGQGAGGGSAAVAGQAGAGGALAGSAASAAAIAGQAAAIASTVAVVGTTVAVNVVPGS